MTGESITLENGMLNVPNNPTIHFIEGDGIGVDISPVMMKVVDAAVSKAYGGEKQIHWSEVLAGEKAFNNTGEWLPEATLDAMRNGLVSIKGPLTTPVGGGIRSLNVALRQKLDLFACVRPVRWYDGTPSPVKAPQDVDMIIFRENSEDVYAGIEWEAGTEGVANLINFLQNEMAIVKLHASKPLEGLGCILVATRDGDFTLTARAFEERFGYGIIKNSQMLNTWLN